MSKNITDPESRPWFPVTRGILKMVGFFPLAAIVGLVGPQMMALELLASIGTGRFSQYQKDQHWPSDVMDWLINQIKRVYPGTHEAVVNIGLVTGIFAYLAGICWLITGGR